MSTEKYHLLELDYETDDFIHMVFDTEDEARQAMKTSILQCYLFKGQLIAVQV